MKITLFVVILLLSISGFGMAAQNNDKAVVAAQPPFPRDYDIPEITTPPEERARRAREVFELYLEYVTKGRAEDQYSLAMMYYQGNGTEQDYVKAREWFEKAAEQNHFASWYELGMLYYNGYGVEQDYAQAFHWLEKAAEVNWHSHARTRLGIMYEEGLSVPRDYVKAMELYRGAESDPNALLRQALLYNGGLGVERDYPKAHELLKTAWGRGARMPENAVFADMFNWFMEQAQSGEAQALYDMGHVYDCGRITPQDQVAAFKWYYQAAQKGHAQAQTVVGLYCQYGYGVAQNDAEAFAWTEKAAMQGVAQAQYALAEMYRDGVGVAKDEKAAAVWFEKAAAQDYPAPPLPGDIIY